MRRFTIHGKDGSPYLTRWTVLDLGRFGQILLHKFHRPDEDPDPHDHPWSFLSLVLKGWYREVLHESRGMGRRVSRVITRKAGSLAYRPAGALHSVTKISPGGVWTLLWTGPKVRDWGFQTLGGWIQWKRYITDPSIQGLRGEPK